MPIGQPNLRRWLGRKEIAVATPVEWTPLAGVESSLKQRPRVLSLQIVALLTAVVPLQACGGERVVQPKMDDIEYLVSVLDENKPDSAEGWTRDVSAAVCPFVTAQLYNSISSSPERVMGVTLTQREIEGAVEIRISRLLSPIWRHALVIGAFGTPNCHATIYSDAH